MIPREILKKIRQIEIRTNRIVTETLAGQYHSVFKGQGMNFDEVREYQPGDDVRAIDWNVTARMNHPFIKKFVEERELTLMLVVDVSGSGLFGSRDQSKRELAAEIASVLAFSAIRNNDKVGLVLFTDEVEKFIPPRKGRKHVLRVIREVLFFEPQRRGTNLPGALDFANKMLAHKAIMVVVSDFLAPSQAPKPADARNFQTATIIDLPRARVVAAVTHGVAGSAMTSFESVLSPVEIAAVARFVETEFLLNRATNTRYHTPENGWPDHTRYRSAFAFIQGQIPLSRPLDRLTAEQRAGRMLFVTHCVTCHDRGGGNDDQGTRATWHKQPR